MLVAMPHVHGHAAAGVAVPTHGHCAVRLHGRQRRVVGPQQVGAVDGAEPVEEEVALHRRALQELAEGGGDHLVRTSDRWVGEETS